MPLGCPSLQQKSDSLTRSGIGDCTDAAAKDSPGSSHRGDESPLDAQTANICHRRLAVGEDSAGLIEGKLGESGRQHLGIAAIAD